MASQWNGGWEGNSPIYAPEQVEAILDELGVEIAHELDTHFTGYCPFHNNYDSPAFEVDKEKGLFCCFNPGCGEAGTLEMLVQKLKGLNPFQAKRFIMRKKPESSLETQRQRARAREFKFVPFPEEPVERMAEQLWQYPHALDYMHSRGFEDETLKHFGVGYSDKMDMIITPMHDPEGMLIGFIGRSASHDKKEFANTDFLPKSRTAWNYHRAKRTGETVIIVESNFDAMRVHQAGYPNVIALLGGGNISYAHTEQINKTFNSVVLMTDFDWLQKNPCARCQKAGRMMCQGHRPGRDLGRKIIAALPTKRFYWAAYDESNVYPHGAKDVGDMSDDEIRQCLKNAVSNFTYSKWDVESLAS